MARKDISSVIRFGNEERAQANFIELYAAIGVSSASVVGLASAVAAASASAFNAASAAAAADARAAAASASAANAASAAAASVQGPGTSVVGRVPTYNNTTGNLLRDTGGLFIDTNQNVVVASAALATNATNGFLYIPTCAGTPTGVPTSFAGRVAFVYDTTNDVLYVYNGSWKGVTALWN